MPRTSRTRRRSSTKQPLIKYHDRVNLVLTNLARSQNYGPLPIPITEVFAAFKEDAEESGQRLGKGWEARVRTCIEANVRDGYLLRCSGSVVRVTERIRNPAREIRREQRSQRSSGPEDTKRMLAKALGQFTGPTANMTKAQLIRHVYEIEGKEKPRPTGAPLQQWPSASTITEMGENDGDEEGMDVDATPARLVEPATPVSPPANRVRFSITNELTKNPSNAYPSPISLIRPSHTHAPFNPEREFPSTPSRTDSRLNAFLPGPPANQGESGPSRFIDHGGPSNALLDDVNTGADKSMDELPLDDDHENMTDPVDQQPREEDSGTDHARELAYRDGKIVDLTTENADLRNQNNTIQTENVTLKKCNVVLEAQCTAAQESIAEKVAELDSVKDSFDQLKKEKIALETQLEELQTQIDELQVEKQTLIGSTQHANAQRDRLQGRIRVLEEDSARKRQEIERLRRDLNTSQSDILDLEDDCDRLADLHREGQDMWDDLNHQNRFVMNEWEHSTRRNAVLQNKIRDYREDIRRARDEKWESRGHIQRCERENRDLKQQNKDLKRDRDAARGRVSRVQANLAEVLRSI